jgi:hypothetical protein
MSVARYLHDVGCDQLVFRDKCTYKIMDTTLLEVSNYVFNLKNTTIQTYRDRCIARDTNKNKTSRHPDERGARRLDTK